jgi:hypothetical protein
MSFTKDISREAKGTVKVFIDMSMETNFEGNGKMMKNIRDNTNFSMETALKGSSKMGKSPTAL